MRAHFMRDLRGHAAHLEEVIDHRTHVGQHPLKSPGDCRHVRRRDRRRPDVHHRFPEVAAHVRAAPDEPASLVAPHGQDGMDHKLHLEAEAGQRGADAVHEERHVVVDDLHDAARPGPSLLRL